jgi:hypothetical protein
MIQVFNKYGSPSGLKNPLYRKRSKVSDQPDDASKVAALSHLMKDVKPSSSSPASVSPASLHPVAGGGGGGGGW